MTDCINYNYSKVFSNLIIAREVSQTVNNTKHESSDCILGIKEYSERHKKCFMDYYIKKKTLTIRKRIIILLNQEETNKQIDLLKNNKLPFGFINEELECSSNDGIIAKPVPGKEFKVAHRIYNHL